MPSRMIVAVLGAAAVLLTAASAMAQSPTADPTVRRVAKLLSFSMAATLCETPLSAKNQTKLEAALEEAFPKQNVITLENVGEVTTAMGTKFMENEASNCAQFKDLDVSGAIDETMQ